MEITMNEAKSHYVEPGWFTRNVFNRSIAFLTRHGVSSAPTETSPRPRVPPGPAAPGSKSASRAKLRI